MNDETGADLLTVAETAARLKMDKTTVYRLCRTSGFPSLRIGNQIRIPAAGLDEWLEGQADWTEDLRRDAMGETDGVDE